jgi:hypothetical protein
VLPGIFRGYRDFAVGIFGHGASRISALANIRQRPNSKIYLERGGLDQQHIARHHCAAPPRLKIGHLPAAHHLSVPFRLRKSVDGMNYSSQRKPPLVRYSNQNRAILLSPESMPKTRSASRPRRQRAATTKRGGNKVRIVRGRAVLKVGGYPGTHRIGTSQLIRFVPLNKVKLAAKRILASSAAVTRRRKKGKKKGCKKNKNKRKKKKAAVRRQQ